MAIEHSGRRALGLARLAVAAAFGLVASAPAISAHTIAMPLCGGGVVDLPLGRKGAPAEPPGACHAGCAMRRDGDEDRPRRLPR